jgi:hypothetical protein
MIIKLTNATPEHKGKSLGINTEHIVTAFRDAITREDGTVEEVTFLFCPPHGTWEVKETIDEIAKLNNKWFK